MDQSAAPAKKDPIADLNETIRVVAASAPQESSATTAILGILSTASMAASAYHGYRRNDSLGWALVWGAAGAIFPVLTPVIALAQGFGEPAEPHPAPCFCPAHSPLPLT